MCSPANNVARRLVELLDTIEFVSPECTLYVVGRAAVGRFRGFEPAWIRVVGGLAAPALLDELELQGVPPMRVSSLSAKGQSLSVAHHEDAACPVNLLFVPDRPASHRPTNMVTGRPVDMVGTDRFRRGTTS